MEEIQNEPSNPNTPRWQFGRLSLWEAAPDVLRLSLVGVVDGPELQAVFDTQAAWGAGKAFWYTIVDVSHLETSTPSSRRVVLDTDPNPNSMAVLFGVSFATRMLIELTMRAKRLLMPGKPHQLMMAATEADAWREVERLRAIRAQNG